MSTRNINVSRYEDEYALFGKALPYIAMLIGAVLVFAVAVVTRIGMWYQRDDVAIAQSSETITWILCMSAVLLSAIAWVLFKKRQQFHPFIAAHAVITVLLCHAWLIMAVWQNAGQWMFNMPTVYTYFYGGAVIGVSWCIRRWAYREGAEGGDVSSDLFETIGLGKAQEPEPILAIKLKQVISSFSTWIIAKLSRMQRKRLLRSPISWVSRVVKSTFQKLKPGLKEK